jgi:hypothetical protein
MEAELESSLGVRIEVGGAELRGQESRKRRIEKWTLSGML